MRAENGAAWGYYHAQHGGHWRDEPQRRRAALQSCARLRTRGGFAPTIWCVGLLLLAPPASTIALPLHTHNPDDLSPPGLHNPHNPRPPPCTHKRQLCYFARDRFSLESSQAALFALLAGSLASSTCPPPFVRRLDHVKSPRPSPDLPLCCRSLP